jgi:hypothetical protein
MQSRVYQSTVNLVVSLFIRRCPSEYMNVMVWERHTFDNKIFGCAKVTTLTSLSLLISCKLSFTIVGLKMSSLPALALKPPTKFSYDI